MEAVGMQPCHFLGDCVTAEAEDSKMRVLFPDMKPEENGFCMKSAQVQCPTACTGLSANAAPRRW